MQKGQLGHGDLRQRNVPTIVDSLKDHQIIAGATPEAACPMPDATYNRPCKPVERRVMLCLKQSWCCMPQQTLHLCVMVWQEQAQS